MISSTILLYNFPNYKEYLTHLSRKLNCEELIIFDGGQNANLIEDLRRDQQIVIHEDSNDPDDLFQLALIGEYAAGIVEKDRFIVFLDDNSNPNLSFYIRSSIIIQLTEFHSSNTGKLAAKASFITLGLSNRKFDGIPIYPYWKYLYHLTVRTILEANEGISKEGILNEISTLSPEGFNKKRLTSILLTLENWFGAYPGWEVVTDVNNRKVYILLPFIRI